MVLNLTTMILMLVLLYLKRKTQTPKFTMDVSF